MNRTRVSALAVFLLVSGQALADEQSEALVRDFVKGVDDSPDWAASVTAIRSDGADTVVEGLSFARQAPAVSITIGTLKLHDLAPRDGGGFSASAMEVGDVALNSDAIDLKAPTLAAKALSIPALPAVVVDPKKMLQFSSDLYTALADAEMAELAIPQVSMVQHIEAGADSGAAVTTVTYNNMRLTDLSGGVLGRSDIGPVTVAVEAGGGMKSQFEIKTVEAERTDFAAVAHILNEAEYAGGAGDGVWRSAVARLRYTGLTGSGGDDATFHLDDASVENVDVRQPPRPFVSRLQGLADANDKTPAQTKLALETVSDVLAAVRVGAVRFSGIGVEAKGNEGGNFDLGSITVLGISGSGIDSFDLRNMDFASPQAIGGLKSLEMSGFVFPDVATYADLVGMDPNLTDKATRNAAIRKAMEGLPQIKRFAMSGLKAGQTESQQVTMNSTTLNFDKFVGAFPTVANFTLDGLVIPGKLLRMDPEAAEVFDALGFTELDLGMNAAETWDNKAGRVTSKLGVAVKGAGETSLSYTYSGVTEDWLVAAIASAADSQGESDTQAAMKVLDGLGFEGATLTVTDRSFLDKAFGYAAQKQGLTISGAAYREQMRGALPFLVSAALNADLAKLVSAPVQAFLAGNQTLIADAKPAASIPVLALAEALQSDPLSVPSLLNLTLRSEPAAPLP